MSANQLISGKCKAIKKFIYFVFNYFGKLVSKGLDGSQSSESYNCPVMCLCKFHPKAKELLARIFVKSGSL